MWAILDYLCHFWQEGLLYGLDNYPVVALHGFFEELKGAYSCSGRVSMEETEYFANDGAYALVV